jgi:hypothetical protein
MSNHDIAVGMIEGLIGRLADPECSSIAVAASTNTAILMARALAAIDSAEDAHYTERLRRITNRQHEELMLRGRT